MDDEFLDIQIQETDDIGARMVLLSAIGFWPQFENYRDRQIWLTWLERLQLLDIATDAELALLRRRCGPTDEDADISSRAFDALWALAWSVRLHDESGISLGTEALGELIDGLPTPTEPIEPFLDEIAVRTEDEIALERERAEVRNWRMAAEVALRTQSGMEATETRQAIAEVVLECSTSLAFGDVDGIDFLLGDAHVGDLADEVLEAAMIASEETLRALNWVCGLNDWESIQLPDEGL